MNAGIATRNPAGGRMLGVGGTVEREVEREVVREVEREVEFLRIALRDGKPTYVAQPGGGPP